MVTTTRSEPMVSHSTRHHAVIILAAGGSKRLGTAKQLVTIDGESLLNRTIRIALDTQPQQTLVVLGHDADRIYASIEAPEVQRVDCIDWQLGMSASLRSGIQNVTTDCQGAVVVLCDQPGLTAEHLNALLNKWHIHPDSAIASAYADVAGVPAIFPRSWFKELLAVEGDQGARTLLRRGRGILQMPAPELAADLDHPDDLPRNFS